MNIIKAIEEIRRKMSKLSTEIMKDKFVETLKVQHPDYLIEKIGYIKKDAQDLIGNVKYQAKQAKK